ncbi:hypothetical protein [Paracoccus saliphilus]|uniref:Uncharacterized protein n=1 Tax=Paracoccus saliphilus TaxID=405559 RepID=A0AA46A642_9RHOB|nr:hypothetical protein [Paracoccus saliphilus]WCR02220.1 hypothetical protein JHX88_15135 [Paracoccus saliphilus]SIS91423.1 hypothetical protein SAMN05421772_108145 [Paracoccus saliphilus]
MSTASYLKPDGSDFDRFLYATVGEDRNGQDVTVLSTLARLGLDPWKEASELAMLSRDAAHDRLSSALSKVRDIPALLREHAAVAGELTRLLPEASSLRASRITETGEAPWMTISGGRIFAVAMILLILAQIFFLGGSETGE